ncbi:MAG: orotate phosphoribosyltransferase [Verrucomicrobia bacterium]|nr:orotate phosphoribosyltransferase [Verrucomicrobiota bacterium]
MAPSILETFEKTGALLHGHFVLSSGLHSRDYFQCALVLQHTELAAKICANLAAKLADLPCDTIISPAMGGIIVGQEVGRNLGKRHIFAEKQDGRLVLRRGFKVMPGERLIVAEDVVTRGTKVLETIEIVKSFGGTVVGVGCMVDRSGDQSPDFGCKFVSLVKLNVEVFEPDKLPPELAAIPVARPGSK